MTMITVWHNLDRDASLGVNRTLRADADSIQREYVKHSHALVAVASWEDTRDSHPDFDTYFRLFNVGADETDAAALKLLVSDYRDRRNRSLSVGDVIQWGQEFWACDTDGWTQVPSSDLHLVASTIQARRLVRERYEFRPDEELALSVPLGSVLSFREV
jgi:hypothetical protein